MISYVLPNGEEKSIAFASKILNKAETNYAQLEREALNIVFGVGKFHQYLYGRKFVLLTDHQPLTTILGPHTGILSLAAARGGEVKWVPATVMAHTGSVSYTVQTTDGVWRRRVDQLLQTLLVSP